MTAAGASITRFAIYVHGNLQLGGAERRFYRLFRFLRERGYDARMCTSEQGAAACRLLGIPLDAAATRILPGQGRSRASAYWSAIGHALALVGWVRRERIEHLHFGSNPGAVTFVYALLSPLGCPFSVLMVDPISDYQRNWRERLYARVTARFGRRIDCLSSQIKIDFGKFLGPGYAARCRVATCSFTEPRTIDPGVSKDIDVALIARMIPWKGHRLLRDALIELERDGMTGLVVYVCGSGPLEAQIRQDFAALTKQNVRIQFEKDPFQILLRTRIFVSLQDTENYPSQSLLEAMTCGCAVVATDVGLTRLLVDESRGVPVSGNPSALAAALRRLLTDEQQRLALGAEARRFVNTQQTIERFADYFVDEVLEAKRVSPPSPDGAGFARGPESLRDERGQSC